MEMKARKKLETNTVAGAAGGAWRAPRSRSSATYRSARTRKVGGPAEAIQIVFWHSKIRKVFPSPGMRKSEAVNLEWSRVDLEGQTIRLRAEDTTTAKPRTIPFGGLLSLAELIRNQWEKAKEKGVRRFRVSPGVSAATFKRHWLKTRTAAQLPTLTPPD